MVAASKTFSGDLSTSLTSSIADLILAAATAGGSKKAQALQLAKQYGVDPMLSKGEFFAQGIAEGATSGLPSFMRYRSPEINESYLARGQSSSDPLMGLPAHLRNLPEYQQFANPLEQKFKVATGRTPYSPLTKQLSGVTGMSPDRAASGQGVKVHDEKLGQFLAVVALSLSASLDSVKKRLNETQEGLITVKDGVLNLHKQLEVSNDVLENKLDQIIDALREQVFADKVRDDKLESKEIEEKAEKSQEQWSTQVAQRVGEDEAEFQDRLQAAELQDFLENVESQQDDLPINEGEDGSGFARGGIASGPDSGYWAKLHGDELITPLDNNFTQGEQLASETPINMNFPKGDNSNNMSPRITNINRSSGNKSSMSMVDRSKNMLKAMELPFKTTGIALMHMLGKSVTGNPIFGQQAPSIKSIAEPVASAFGVNNSITNNVMKTASSQEHENKRREETQNYTTKTKKPWWESITDLFSRDEPVVEEDDEKKDTTESGITSSVESKTGMVIPKNDIITNNSTTNKNWFEGAKNWWNRGRNARVPNENMTRWFGKKGLIADDWKQRGKFGKGGKMGGWDVTRGFRPGVPASEGGMMSGPTPAIRQSIERPLRAIRSLGSLKGGFIGLILNELMNPAPLADGTLEGNKNADTDFSNLEKDTIETNNLVLQKSMEVDSSSKENIFTKMESKTVDMEPVVINNQQEINDDLGSEDPSYIQLVGDTGFDDFYPSPY
tara:strand:- start:1378 stop:3558 length:2181 start_codon:yes stop_codon:yes gene_type:complete